VDMGRFLQLNIQGYIRVSNSLYYISKYFNWHYQQWCIFYINHFLQYFQ
jgi:hypothetical protein